MTLSISQSDLESGRPRRLPGSLGRGHDVFDSNVDIAHRIMDTATSDWSGSAATAAWDSATQQHAFGRDAVAIVGDAGRCVAAQSANLRYTRETLVSRVDDASADGFTVSDDGSVTATPVTLASTDPRGVEARLEYHSWRIGTALTDVDETDASAARILTEITAAGTSLIDRKADFGIPDAASTTPSHHVRFDGQGAHDSDILAQSPGATPESEAAKQRLIAATTFTPEQQAQLAAGGPVVVDPEQLAYLREFYADTNLDELKNIGAGAEGFRTVNFPDANVPADARIPSALASGMFTVSNPNVTDGNGNAGSLDNLPPDVRRIFSDPAYSSQLQPGGYSTTVNVNHFDDSNALTDILRMRPGDTIRQRFEFCTARSQRRSRPSPIANFIERPNTIGRRRRPARQQRCPRLQPHQSPRRCHSGHTFERRFPHHPCSSGRRGESVHPRMERYGRAVSGLTDWIGPDATNSNPAVAERAGASALALAHNLADNKGATSTSPAWTTDPSEK